MQAQDLAHYKRVVKEISSAKYQGRGYAKGGANKTGRYLQKEYRKAGVDELRSNLSPSTSTRSAERWRCGLMVNGCKQVWIFPCVSILLA